MKEDKRAKKATQPNRKAGADLEQRRRHQKWVADLQASYDRRLGVPIGVAQYQEKLIRDARTYATSYLLEAPSQVAQLRVTRLALTELGITPNSEKFPLSFEALHKAIWTEGDPSLEELANKAGGTQSADTGARPKLSVKEGSEADRRAAVDAYIDEVFNRTGKRITRTDIWKKAGYKSRTEFERWERNDPNRPNKAAHENFTRILSEKPHLK